MGSTARVNSQISDSATTAAKGLSSQEAERRLEQYGPNEPVKAKRGATVLELVFLFLNPLVIILLVASLASLLLGDATDALVIFVIVLLGVFISFIQTYRSQQAINRLRETVTLTATALRDSNWVEVPRREIVPGDVVRISAGDLMPADGELLEARDLFVHQAALTGESMPVEKSVNHAAAAAGEEEAPNRVFLGTSVVSGTGIVVIEKTGPNTEFGEIAERLAARPEETEFERSMRRFSTLIMKTVFFLVLFILVVRISMHKDAFESFVFAVALAVGLTPEFLPMISSVTLARGAERMAKEQVVVKHLPAIQNFGSIDIFCSDKTGTLTTGQMTLDRWVDYCGGNNERAWDLAYLNSQFETGIRSPLDVAILKADRDIAKEYAKVDEIPFDFERRRLSIVVEKTGGDGAAKRLLITKGAPEGILERSQWYEAGGQRLEFDAQTRPTCRKTFDDLSAQGFRVLAVAYREVEARAAYTIDDEKELTFCGYLTFADPPNPDAAASLAALERDGVQVKILTGDNELVARHVCQQVGLKEPAIILGQELESMSDPALQHLAEETDVFARVSPVQKHRIIHALKVRGHVVGYMGDGINDAPSLHAADVGISVATAVDVARDASDIILLKPGLDILHKGVLEGRRASANVMKYLLMGTSSNFGNMFSMAGASLFLPFLPMLPTQILLNNFMYDAAQITIPTDNVDPSYLSVPRRWDMKIIRNFMIYIGPISSIYDFLTFYVLIHFFRASEPAFHTGWFVESLATQTLVLFVIRTTKNPFKSRPSGPLAFTTVLIVIIGVLLPYTGLAKTLGFTPLPRSFYGFLALATATYLVLVEIAKRALFSRAGF
ncbi:MAG TPA: magnesium-translocating P-type ATPase [Candidatus Acidoferrales bacterium]|jgi:Mg2+-importing ATPase|nr:magnesium-translocating P-type ATPase [Candidatus Acidoferrales bacterium]